MRGSTFMRALAGFVLALVVVGLGVAVYQAGVANGLAEAGRLPAGAAAAGAAVPYPGYGWGFGFHPFGVGFGLFGIVWFLLVVLFIVALVRFAFGFGRRGGWGRGPSGYGGGGPWTDDRRRRLEEIHRELHDELDRGSTASGPSTPPAR